MNVVIVDDSEFKRYSIKKYISLIDGSSSYKEFLSLDSGLKYLNNYQDDVDLLVLDWKFPIYDYEQAKDALGDRFLYYMKKKSIIVPTIICSSDDVFVDDEYFFVIGKILFDSNISLENEFRANLEQEKLYKVKIKTKLEDKYE